MHFPIHRSYEPCPAQNTLYCELWKNCVHFNGSWWKWPFQANYDHFCTKMVMFSLKKFEYPKFHQNLMNIKVMIAVYGVFDVFSYTQEYEPCLAQSTLYCGFWRIVFISMGIGENYHFRPIMTIFAENGHVFLEKVWISKNSPKFDEY